jgi:glycosyltransferase involved in cell wall biosynthesis
MPKCETPYITALISTYNASHLLGGCLESLFRQTVAPELEIIVVDSGSETNDYEVAIELQSQHPRLHCLRTARRENSHTALNRAIQLARGKYLIIANTDDRQRQDALQIMASLLDKEPEVALVFADTMRTSKMNETFDEAAQCGRPIVRWPDYQPWRLFGDARIGPQPMWRRSLHAEIGPFDDSLIYAGDYEMWLRISALTTHKLYHLNEVLGLWYDVPSNNSQARPDLVDSEVEIVRQRYRYRLITAGKLSATASPLDSEIEAIEQSLSGKKIALFGAGERGARVFKALSAHGHSVTAFLDNDPEKQGNCSLGMPVLSPEAAKRACLFDLVLIASMYWAEIAMQLESFGLVRNKDYCICFS